MRLSKRLNKVLEIMQNGRLLVDIGCDHGYVCIEAIKQKKAVNAIAADTARGPVLRAKQNIESAGLSDRIETVLSDGFKAFESNILPDCVNITGMGGRLIVKILSEGTEKGIGISDIKQLILGPQSEADILRHYLIDELGMHIEKEHCVFDEGKYYMLLDVRGCKNSKKELYSEADYLYGKNIDINSEKDFSAYLKAQEDKLELALNKACEGSDTKENRLKRSELGNKLGLLRTRI